MFRQVCLGTKPKSADPSKHRIWWVNVLKILPFIQEYARAGAAKSSATLQLPDLLSKNSGPTPVQAAYEYVLYGVGIFLRHVRFGNTLGVAEQIMTSAHY